MLSFSMAIRVLGCMFPADGVLIPASKICLVTSSEIFLSLSNSLTEALAWMVLNNGAAAVENPL